MIRKLALLTLLSCLIISCKTETKEVVFVCTHGAARSPIAAAYFNKLAKERNLEFRAVFRGTEPDETLTKETHRGLTQDGFEINDWKPEKIAIQDVKGAYKVVTFYCSIPWEAPLANLEQWNGTPSISKDYDAACEVIRSHVEELLESLEKE